MPVFFHVQRSGVSGFRVGRSYTFGPEQNYFARDLMGVEVMVPVAGTSGLPVDQLLRDYLDPTGMGHYRQIRSKAVTPDERGLLKSALSVLNHQAMVLREFVFEQVRQEAFPAKPSRLKGIWLIPHEEDLLAQWCATAPHGQFRAFEVEAEGRFHHGASRWLQPECLSVPTLRDHARRYWGEPANPLSEPAEILLEGEVKVLRELRLPGSRQTTWAKLRNLFG